MIEADVDENGFVPLEEEQPPIPATVFYRRPVPQVNHSSLENLPMKTRI